MSLEPAIVSWVRDYLVAAPALHTHDKEFGCLFWARDGKDLIADPMVWSPDRSSVQLYAGRAMEIVAKRVKKNPDQYFGEFHAHPISETWVGQLPSPEDLFLQFSALMDHYEFAKPFAGELFMDDLYAHIQTILLLKFGHQLVVCPFQGRARFSDIENQKADLSQRQTDYSNWHRQADHRLGRLDPNISLADYEAILYNEVASINRIINGRAYVTIIPPP